MPRVALDAMGGDHAPEALVAGALAAAGDGIDVVLVGQRDRLAAGAGSLEVVDAPDSVDMDEDPAGAVRRKRESSVRVAARLVAEGSAAAMVSAGSTGATLAAGVLELGRLPGVRRPVVIPTPDRKVVLLDAGAVPDVEPETLVGYARMGAAYAQALGVDEPTVGLLNIGAEPGKGNAFAVAAADALAGVDVFVGNTEPDVVLAGGVDVVVTDGWTGNIFLKTVEACAPFPDETPGAAVLLGVPGEVLVAHGGADEQEVAAALRTADAVARAGLSARIGALLDDGG
jgi:phosphate acyltransferase